MYTISDTTDGKHIGRSFTFSDDNKIVNIKVNNGESINIDYDYKITEDGYIRFVSPHYTIIGKSLN